MTSLRFKNQEEYDKWLQDGVTSSKPVETITTRVKKLYTPKEKAPAVKKPAVKKESKKKKPESDFALKGVKTLQQGISFVKGSAKDYVSHVTQSTGTVRGTRGEYSRNGLRSEWTAHGYTGDSGTPELDNRWGRATRTEAPGNLNIGGRPRVKGSLTRPAPSFNDMNFNFSTDVKLPNVRKIKGRKL